MKLTALGVVPLIWELPFALILIIAAVWYFSQPSDKNSNPEGWIKKREVSSSAKAGPSQGEVKVNSNDGLKYVCIPPDQLTSSGLDSAIVKVIEKWVATTKNGDLEGRMALYSDRLDIFYRKPNLSKANVEQEIRTAMSAYSSFFTLELSNVTWRELRAGVVQVEFDKDYTANKRTGGWITGRVHSMLTLVRTGESWSIIGERDLKIYAKSQSPVMATVNATQKDLPKLQKVRHIIAASTHPNNHDFETAINTDFYMAIVELIDNYTCFKEVKPGDAPPDNEHFPGYALVMTNPAYAMIMTDVEVDPIAPLNGAPRLALFYNVSVTNPGGTLWDGNTTIYVHGREGQSSEPDTVLAVVSILKTLAKEACPK
jgi:ketosteroid isomerase-like protein